MQNDLQQAVKLNIDTRRTDEQTQTDRQTDRQRVHVMQNDLQKAVKLNIDRRPTNERTERQTKSTCHAKRSRASC